MIKICVTRIALICLVLTFSQLASANGGNTTKKNNAGVLEVVRFSSRHEYTDKQITKRASDVTSILRSYPGFISREFSTNVKKTDDWIDIVHWSSLNDALMAAKKIVRTPQMKKFMAVMKGYKIYHFKIKFEVDK